MSRLQPHHSVQVCLHRDTGEWWANILNPRPEPAAGCWWCWNNRKQHWCRAEGETGNVCSLNRKSWRWLWRVKHVRAARVDWTSSWASLHQIKEIRKKTIIVWTEKTADPSLGPHMSEDVKRNICLFCWDMTFTCKLLVTILSWTYEMSHTTHGYVLRLSFQLLASWPRFSYFWNKMFSFQFHSVCVLITVSTVSLNSHIATPLSPHKIMLICSLAQRQLSYC